MAFLLKLIFGLVVLALAAALWLTYQSNQSASESTFAKGTLPDPILDGFYKGSVNAPVKVTWLGKKFATSSVSTSTQMGINVFEDSLGKQSDKYPFKYSVQPALREPGIKVIAIDYDLPDNPFWVRPVLDELVQISTSTYLGKLNYRLIPNFPFTLGFFRLEK